jgi:hypothetical protein
MCITAVVKRHLLSDMTMETCSPVHVFGEMTVYMSVRGFVVDGLAIVVSLFMLYCTSVRMGTHETDNAHSSSTRRENDRQVSVFMCMS